MVAVTKSCSSASELASGITMSVSQVHKRGYIHKCSDKINFHSRYWAQSLFPVVATCKYE